MDVMTKAAPRIITRISSSLCRAFGGEMPRGELSYISAMRNEPISFQLSYRSDYEKADGEKIPDLPISVSAVCDGLDISAYKVGYLPLDASLCDDGRKGGGCCPDLLYRRSAAPEVVRGDDRMIYYEAGERNLLNVSCVSTGSVWFTVNERGVPLEPGDYDIRVTVTQLYTGETVAEHTVTLHVVDALLPENELIYSNWIHFDCLCDRYGVEIGSDAFFEILEAYLKNAVLHGMTALLIPAFTPALDTVVGGERMNVQLVRVEEREGEYFFDLSRLERLMRLADACGIRYFEHCHLFSQWGADRAINIYAEADGETRRIFSAADRADGEAYSKFIGRYLREYIALCDRLGISSERLLFHVSDEPKGEHEEAYRRAYATVRKAIGDRVICDALSDYSFYENRLVDLPIVSTSSADSFDGRCDRLMLYYTAGSEDIRLSNRTITASPSRARVLGVHLYRYRSLGFLHWGYNNYYGRMSLGEFDPATEPTGYRNMYGASFLIYPGFDRRPIPSVREKQMRDAISDCLALRLLESYIGYEATLALCEEVLGEPIGIRTQPQSESALLELRLRVNREIEKHADRARMEA